MLHNLQVQSQNRSFFNKSYTSTNSTCVILILLHTSVEVSVCYIKFECFDKQHACVC